jgi:hypothetical protein
MAAIETVLTTGSGALSVVVGVALGAVLGAGPRIDTGCATSSWMRTSRCSPSTQCHPGIRQQTAWKDHKPGSAAH